MFDKKMLSSKQFTIPVIGIGNLSTGGTGKSPHTIYVVNKLKEQFNVAVISRGYGRKSSGMQTANYESNYKDIGDEPLQIFERFRNQIMVIVSSDRVEAIEYAIKKFQSNLIVLDDIFQHRYVQSGLNILLTEYDNLYIEDSILPLGNLRESKKGAKRADVVIVTKSDMNLPEIEKKKVEQELGLEPHQKLFFSSIKYYHSVINRKEKRAIKDLIEYEIVLVSGIANPKPLVDYVETLCQKVHHLEYKDHHHFSEKDIQNIRQKSLEIKGKKLILTTEKDYMRLQLFAQITENLYYLPINIVIDKEVEFNQILQNYVQKK